MTTNVRDDLTLNTCYAVGVLSEWRRKTCVFNEREADRRWRMALAIASANKYNVYCNTYNCLIAQIRNII